MRAHNSYITSFFIMTTFVLQTYAMENALISMHMRNKLDAYKQLNISYDLLHKICSLCSHKTQCAIELTCKQFYCAASINQLHKLVSHDFIIGDKNEKGLSFTIIFNKKNLSPMIPLLNYAQKEAQSLPHDAILIKLNNYSYLTPLLEETIEEENTPLIDRLEKKDVDTNILKDGKKRRNRCHSIFLCTSIGSVALILFGVTPLLLFMPNVWKNHCFDNTTLDCWTFFY